MEKLISSKDALNKTVERLRDANDAMRSRLRVFADDPAIDDATRKARQGAVLAVLDTVGTVVPEVLSAIVDVVGEIEAFDIHLSQLESEIAELKKGRST